MLDKVLEYVNSNFSTNLFGRLKYILQIPQKIATFKNSH